MIVVEHDREVIQAADYIIELGPGPGDQGGRITASGPSREFLHSDTLTAAYLRGERRIPRPENRRELSPGLRILGARANNLRGFDLDIPAGGLIALTGVSGSGKSTLMREVLAASFRAGRPLGCRRITGWERFERLIQAEQAPLSSGPTGIVAGRAGLFDALRAMMADTPAARQRGWNRTRFSLAAKGGRCEACRGTGIRHVHLDFLSDVRLPCEECRGRRYSRETLEVTWQGLSIMDILDLSVSRARKLLAGAKRISDPLESLEAVGLGYLRLGQSVATLSGGESQRLKLAAELAGTSKGTTLYLFDEPTTGLHLEDVRRLLALFHQLVDLGHTLLVIEHHPDVLLNADWIIDLGPDGGEGGGRMVAQGRPEDVAAADTPTGRYLSRLVGREPPAIATHPD